MRSLMELYEEIYQHILWLSDKIAGIESNISGIRGKRSEEIPARIANLKKQLEKIDEYQLKIEGFRQLAEKNLTSKNVLTIEAPPGYRVNLNRLRTWAMMIDPMSNDDPYAQRVYLVAKCDLCFLEQKKQEFQARIAELEKDQASDTTDEIKALEDKLHSLRQELQQYLTGEAMTEFAARVRDANAACLYKEAPETYQAPGKTPEYWIPGLYGLPFGVEASLRGTLKNLFGQYYDEQSSSLFMPVELLSAKEEFAMTVSCVPARTRLNEMDAGIRNLIFRMIDRSPACARKVYLLDAVRQNSALAGSLKQLEGSFVLKSIPRNREQLASVLEELLSSFNDMDEVLENCDSVAEYNATVSEDKQIPRSLVVLVGWPEAFEGDTKEYIKRIVTNYERYGISFVIVKITTKADEDFGLSEYIGENVVRIAMTGSDSTFAVGNAAPRKFLWNTFKHDLKESYVKSVQRYSAEKQSLGNEYNVRFDIESQPVYTRAYKKIELPFGVDSKDVIHSMSFENENFASYLVGASRSGKSTLLHVLIAGLIRNYHPDNMELWLADFKQLEFKSYIEHLPPHVKYVLLDESPELVYDLIDKLTERMLERQHLFGKLNVKRIDQVDPRKLAAPLPIIFVILDEFSIMSQSVSDSPTYKLKLQNLLAKGAALGIRFLFSSQTFTKGIGGLTNTAKDQIQQRIAMKASKEEVEQTLELSASLKTDQVRLWMEAFPVHYAMVKQWSSTTSMLEVIRVLVLYFKDYDVRDKMIDDLNQTYMRKVDHYIPDDPYAYVDKHPVLVDGNSYDVFSTWKFMERLELLRNNTDDYNGDEIFAMLGTPRLMVNWKPVVITPESRQNLLLIADARERDCCASVVTSMMRSFELQGKQVEIWAYNRNKVYRAYRDDVWSDIETYDTLSEICREIRKLAQQLQKGEETGEKLLVLFGFESVVSEFELLDASKSVIKTAVAAPKVDIRAEMAKQGALASEEESEEEKAKRAKLMMLMADDDEDEEELVDLSEGQEEEELADLSEAQSAEEDEQTTQDFADTPAADVSDDKQDEYLYNAKADLEYIMKQGSRQGVHVMLCVNSFADLKQTGLSLDYFKHRLAFQIPVDDSRLVFSNKSASELPEHICLYSDLMTKYSFRPYLHPGLSWDGWLVDEEGNAKNSFENIM